MKSKIISFLAIIFLLLLAGCSDLQLESDNEYCHKVCYNQYIKAIENDKNWEKIVGWKNQYNEPFNIEKQCNKECRWSK